MAYQLSDINHRAARPGEFMTECDRAFQEKVTLAADRIQENLARSPVVLLSGPSGSGKTTTALKIEEELERRGVATRTFSMDHYFNTLDPATAPKTPEGAIDFESPLMLDWELLDRHFTALEVGEPIFVPHFEFARQMRNDSRAVRVQLEPNEVAIFEGIHALSPRITAAHPNALRLYISARSDILDGDEVCFKSTWLRLARRAVRDYNFRGTGVAETLAMWGNVRRGEKAYISPYKESAHVMFDSALPYEVNVMANYARPILAAIPPENQRTHELFELIAAFDRFTPIDPALVPGNSLLREFIGGSDYHY